jgi:prevent-host-death family protein
MMTMVEGFMRTMAAGKFKATCLGVLDQVQANREPVTVTKNGKPVARVIPVADGEDDPIFGFYRGKMEITGDILAPLYTEDEYEEFFEASMAQLK